MGPPRFGAKLDERPRAAKAQKIAMLSGVARPPPGAAMLYCGSGSGDIAAYFSRLGFGESGTFALDAVDTDGGGLEYQFSGVLGTKLPFPDGRFDFIVSNHVIKHFADPKSAAACATTASSILPCRTAGDSSMHTIDSPSSVGCRGGSPIFICD